MSAGISIRGIGVVAVWLALAVMRAQAQPTNDAFASGASLSGAAGSRLGSNVDATKEPGEPDHAGDQGGASVWYSWTAPTGGAITFDTLGSSFDTLLAVYSGDSVTNLSVIVSNDDIDPGIEKQSRVTFTPNAGMTYRIAVDGYGGDSGNLVLHWTTATGPAAVIADAWWTYQQDCNGDGCLAGTLAGDKARLNWNPDVVDCNGTISVYEIVYSKPCADTNWTAVYTNAVHSITGCRSSDSQFYDVPLGSNCVCLDYQIEVYREDGAGIPDYVRSAANDSDLAQHREQPLAEDFCLSDYFATCAAISGVFGTRMDNNTTASKEPGEPNHAGDAGGKSLWYCWTAPTNTLMTLDTIGSSFDTLLAVYTGENVSNLTEVASNNDIAGAANRQSSVTFTPIAGTTYRIAVDGFGGASGTVVLNWNQSGGALADLIIWAPAASPEVITRTFASNDCEVVEGCETPGLHALLSFTTETRNIGQGDLVLGDPSTNSLFHYASCHGHYHFEEFADYSLLDGNGVVVAAGHKVGFCLEDVHAWAPNANPNIKYDCLNQGIQAGWADVYSAGLPCQYIDVTGIPPGPYTLKLVVNSAGLLPESNTNNNVALVAVTIPENACTGPPMNDRFANALVVSNAAFSFTENNSCASTEPGEPEHAGDAGGHSVWFSWTPVSNQTAVITTKRSDFDTLLAVYTGNSVGNLSLIADNDDIITDVIRQSYLSFPATAGTTYKIAVDGWSGEWARWF